MPSAERLRPVRALRFGRLSLSSLGFARRLPSEYSESFELRALQGFELRMPRKQSGASDGRSSQQKGIAQVAPIHKH